MSPTDGFHWVYIGWTTSVRYPDETTNEGPEGVIYEIMPSDISIDDADIMLELYLALGYMPEIRDPRDE